MSVFLYQLGIFLAIQIVSRFGKNSRNIAIMFISFFTILQVFMTWLLLLQFITIIISYIFSEQLFFQPKEKNKINNENINRIKHEYNSKNTITASKELGKKVKTTSEMGCGYILLFFSILALIKLIMGLLGVDRIYSYSFQIIITIVSFTFGWVLTRKE